MVMRNCSSREYTIFVTSEGPLRVASEGLLRVASEGILRVPGV